jgi:hypothetical protein
MCNICSHTWEHVARFRTLAELERHDFTATPCPKCSAETCTILPPLATPDAAAGFQNEIDDEDPADAWKRAE